MYWKCHWTRCMGFCCLVAKFLLSRSRRRIIFFTFWLIFVRKIMRPSSSAVCFSILLAILTWIAISTLLMGLNCWERQLDILFYNFHVNHATICHVCQVYHGRNSHICINYWRIFSGDFIVLNFSTDKKFCKTNS